MDRDRINAYEAGSLVSNVDRAVYQLWFEVPVLSWKDSEYQRVRHIYQVKRKGAYYCMCLGAWRTRTSYPGIVIEMHPSSRGGDPSELAREHEDAVIQIDSRWRRENPRWHDMWGATRCRWMVHKFMEVAYCDWFFRGGQGL